MIMSKIIQNSDRFFRNVDCKYFPCHDNVEPEQFNCLFCFCPLYSLINCGESYTISENGVKNCTNCVFPHKAGNYDAMLKKLMKCLRNTKFPKT